MEGYDTTCEDNHFSQCFNFFPSVSVFSPVSHQCLGECLDDGPLRGYKGEGSAIVLVSGLGATATVRPLAW